MDPVTPLCKAFDTFFEKSFVNKGGEGPLIRQGPVKTKERWRLVVEGDRLEVKKVRDIGLITLILSKLGIGSASLHRVNRLLRKEQGRIEQLYFLSSAEKRTFNQFFTFLEQCNQKRTGLRKIRHLARFAFTDEKEDFARAVTKLEAGVPMKMAECLKKRESAKDLQIENTPILPYLLRKVESAPENEKDYFLPAIVEAAIRGAELPQEEWDVTPLSLALQDPGLYKESLNTLLTLGDEYRGPINGYAPNYRAHALCNLLKNLKTPLFDNTPVACGSSLLATLLQQGADPFLTVQSEKGEASAFDLLVQNKDWASLAYILNTMQKKTFMSHGSFLRLAILNKDLAKGFAKFKENSFTEDEAVKFIPVVQKEVLEECSRENLFPFTQKTCETLLRENFPECLKEIFINKLLEYPPEQKEIPIDYFFLLYCMLEEYKKSENDCFMQWAWESAIDRFLAFDFNHFTINRSAIFFVWTLLKNSRGTFSEKIRDKIWDTTGQYCANLFQGDTASDTDQTVINFRTAGIGFAKYYVAKQPHPLPKEILYALCRSIMSTTGEEHNDWKSLAKELLQDQAFGRGDLRQVIRDEAFLVPTQTPLPFQANDDAQTTWDNFSQKFPDIVALLP